EGGQDFLGSGAAVFLVGDTGDEDVPAQRPTRGGPGRGDHHRRDATLHVEGAAAEHPAVADLGAQRVAVVVEADRVDVTVEHERPTTAGTAHDPDDGRSAGPFLHPVHLEAAGGQPLAAVVGDRAFARPAGNQ